MVYVLEVQRMVVGASLGVVGLALSFLHGVTIILELQLLDSTLLDPFIKLLNLNF